MTPIITWRSMLFVPATREDFIAKAPNSQPDAVILDLEDSVASSQKAAARDALLSAVSLLQGDNVGTAVRVNSSWRHLIRDLEAAVLPGVSVILLPKVASAQHIAACDAVVTELEEGRRLPHGSISFVALIEDPVGLLHSHEIAVSSNRLVGLTFGVEDYATCLGVAPTRDLATGPTSTVVTAAHAAGLQAFGLAGSIASFKDIDRLERDLEFSKSLGISATYAIHPSQVAAINRAYTPTAEQIKHAESLVEAYQAGLREGVGAVGLAGEMIDEPIYRRANRTLARTRSIHR